MIKNIIKKLNLKSNEYEIFGTDKAKITKQPNEILNSKLILVTAINPTTAGEGKTTVSIGLADALNLIGKKVCLALREPSLGPVFGMKGGATGGGKSRVIPSDEINLHFTGDFHAITSANNLLCAMIDNHIYQGNKLNIQKVVFNRCLDMNDRALRDITIVGDKKKNIPDRTETFNITAASEIMAIMCLANDLSDLKKRLGDILVAYDKSNNPIYAWQLNAQNAMTILLKDALKPNLVETLIHTPAIIHCGPFANIAHGCNSIIATKLAMSLADYCVTEAGFGADLGAEKFLDFKCRIANLNPNVVVLVATIKALKLHGGATEENSNFTHLENGMCNLYKHIDNITKVYKLPCIVALNKFENDTESELKYVEQQVKKYGIPVEIVDVWTQSGTGAIQLAEQVIKMCDKKSKLNFCYNLEDSIAEKCEKIAKNIYGADEVDFTNKAKQDLEEIKTLNLESLPVIIAKTQYSLSDNLKLIGVPKGYKITIKEFQIRNGAKFIVAVAGNILLMPGLPKIPKATKMEITELKNGKYSYKL